MRGHVFQAQEPCGRPADQRAYVCALRPVALPAGPGRGGWRRRPACRTLDGFNQEILYTKGLVVIEPILHPGVSETSLCRILGVSRNRLRDLRQKNLQYGADWNLEKKRVVYHGRGVEKIRGILLLPPEKIAPAGSSAQAEAVPSLPETETLLVLKPMLSNKRMILAYRPGTDPSLLKNQIRVRVKDSKNFIRFVNGKPMELKARRVVGGAPDHFELAGACPRRRGRY